MRVYRVVPGGLTVPYFGSAVLTIYLFLSSIKYFIYSDHKVAMDSEKGNKIKFKAQFFFCSKFEFLAKNLGFWLNFRMVIHISNFHQNFEPKLRFLPKVSSFDWKIVFLTKVSMLDQNFDLCPKFRVLTKISIFAQHF